MAASENRLIILALCAYDQWTRFDKTFTRQVLNISTAISQSLSGATKNADEDCKLAVETLQESVKVCQPMSHCFTFHVPLFPIYLSTRQNIQSHCFYSPVFRPSRNYCLKLYSPLNKVSISVNPWVFCKRR